MSDNQIEWQYKEVTKNSERVVQAHGERKYRTRMQLTQNQKQAATDLEIAFELRSKGWGYALLGTKMVSFARVQGGEPSQEKIDWIRKRLGMLHGWEWESKRHVRHAVEVISTQDITPTEYAHTLDVSYQTVVNWYKEGLDKYIELFF